MFITFLFHMTTYIIFHIPHTLLSRSFLFKFWCLVVVIRFFSSLSSSNNKFCQHSCLLVLCKLIIHQFLTWFDSTNIYYFFLSIQFYRVQISYHTKVEFSHIVSQYFLIFWFCFLATSMIQVLMTTLQTKYNEFLGPCFVVMKVQFIIFFVFTDH